jgi:hypothetical protein
MRLFSEYLTEHMTYLDWNSLLASKPSADQLPPESELKYLAIQGPLFAIIAMHYYMSKGIKLSDDLWIVAITHNKAAANLIPKEQLTPELMLELVKANPTVITIFFDHGLTVPENVIELAVSKQPDNIKHIPNPSEELKLAAVKKRGILIKSCKNPSKELLNTALTEPKFIKNEKHYNKFVKQHFKDNTVLMNKWLRYAKNVREMV